MLITKSLSSFFNLVVKLSAITVLFISSLSHAIDLEHLVTFNKIENTQFNWQQIVPHPSKQNHFYVFSKQGKITEIIKGKTAETELLDITKALNVGNIQLTSLTLHPNFALKDLPGYHVFYTAHQETFNDKKRLIRLPKAPLDNSEYDLVVNEWQLLSDGKQADSASKREIIRIASPAKATFIQQLSFNPYLKPWQDDFGALFITLNSAEEHQQIPLYSGAILRIHPDKFGLRNYTVPESNVFNNDAEIANEIIALGAKNITKILWQKKNNQQWFFLAEQEQKTTLSLIDNGDDLRKENIKPLWQSDTANGTQQVVWYEGRKLSDLLYKLITVSFTGEQWKLASLTVAANKAVDEVMLTNIQNRDPQAKLGLMINSDFELMLLNTTDGIISQVNSLTDSQNKDASDGDSAASSALSEETYQQIYLWLAVFLIMALGIFTVKKIKTYDREKALVRKLYARFELSHQGQRINLFKRHQKVANVTLPLTDITSSAIILNNQVVNFIDHQEVNVFNNVEKTEMHRKFALEHRLKMVDNKARVIIVELTDKDHHKYQICLYARRGNQRYTRIDYQECLNIITLWCWSISEKINPHHTEVDDRNNN